jgi:hypothetical protein
VTRVLSAFLVDDLRARLIDWMRAGSRFMLFAHARDARARLGCKKGLARTGHQGLKRL